MKILKGKQQKPRRVMLYGVHGIGKSTWAAGAPSPVFVDLEDGLNDLECDKTPLITRLDRFDEAILFLANNDHEYKTIVIDSVDWLEGLIEQSVAEANGKKSFGDFDFGKGHKLTLAYWDKILFKLEWLRSEKNMTIILLAHTQVKRYNSPESEAYDRYTPKLHESVSGMLQEWCDEVLFANYEVFTKTEDQGFGKKRAIAGGGNTRYLQTCETPAALAKNRLSMPGRIGFSWSDYASYFSKGESNG